MIEIIEVAVLRRQHLQQHTGRRGVAFRFAGADEQAGWQLLGLAEVGFGHSAGFTFQTDHALIALAFRRRNGDDHDAVADHLMQGAVVGDRRTGARNAAHLLTVVAVDHRQLQRAVALQLHGDVAVELQGRGQQTGGDQQFAQQLCTGAG